MTNRKYLGVWLALSGWTTLLPITIIAHMDGYQLWGDQRLLQPNLQRCHPDIQDKCVLSHWCESIDLSQGVRSPFTSYSNILFMILGCAIFTLTYYGSRCQDNHLKTYPYLSYHYAFVLWWTGCSSFLCHASGLPITRELDRSGIWGIILYPFVLAILRIGLAPLSTYWYQVSLCVFYMVWFILTLYHIIWGNQSNAERDRQASDMLNRCVPIMIVCLIILIYIEECLRYVLVQGVCRCLPLNRNHLKTYTLKTNHSLSFISVVFGIMGYLLQDPQRIGLTCHPTQLEWYHQTHGYWHICIAIAYFTIWWMYITEKKIPQG